MPINADKPHLWKADVAQSIDFYNDWFIRFAPETYRRQRGLTTAAVLDAFIKTGNLTKIVPEVLRSHPGLLPILRMVTAPPLARDRLMGLSYVGKGLITAMEGQDDNEPRLPKRMSASDLQESLVRLCDTLLELIDKELFSWLETGARPSKREVDRAATVVADRMCGASSDPIIRNAQEKRQLASLKRWLRKNGYKEVATAAARDPRAMPAGTYTVRLSLPGGRTEAPVSIPIDCVIQPLTGKAGDIPILIEAKSAGDATNTNKRRKEEAQKFRQLKERYGETTRFILYLCGYFEPGYLGYEAAEGIDWVWEHRTDDLGAVLGEELKKKRPAVRDGSATYGATETDAREQDRASSQKRADALKSADERNKLGQFATPFPLARQIVSKALRFMPDRAALLFLEPALGSGVFFSALMRCAGDRAILAAAGCEIDPAYGEIARTTWAPLGLSVHQGDFLDFAMDAKNHGRFNLLCTNPPYIRHHHLRPELKLRLQTLIAARLGLQPSGLSGFYVYYILLADRVLADGAIATWLLPAEFLYVNYGKVLRDYLTQCVTLLSVHHFDPEEVQFDDALVSSCVVTYRKRRPAADAECELSYGGDVLAARETRTLSLAELRTLNKWTQFHFAAGTASGTGIRLKELFSVRRGIATGANEFFLIDKETAHRFEIPARFLKPILPSPRHVPQSVIEANDDGTPKIPGFRYLLDCTMPPEEVSRVYPGLWRYLESGVKAGLPERYLCASREVWYFQERREPAPLLASYMGRAKSAGACPIRFFANFSKALVTNVFLNLYPSPGLREALGDNRARLLELQLSLDAIPSDCIREAGRAYGGGLHKIEPKELLELQLPQPPSWLRETVGGQLVLI